MATETVDLESLNDFEAAEAVRDGKLPSPTKYGEFWLFDLRITGTGHAWRETWGEWAHRDETLWTSDAFVQRCNGLPVIFEHPERSGLDSQEWNDRIIGTIVIPYVKTVDDSAEVWGIAKIFDADAAMLMQTTHVSTSPGVTPPQGAKPTELKDGSKVLTEGLPRILDHLAVCRAGVWDKDGPPEGIRLDRKDASMAEKSKEEYERELDDMKRRADAAEKDRDSFKAKNDEWETKAKKDSDEAERLEREKADKAKKDSDAEAEREREKADKAKKDADEREEETKRADARKAKHDAENHEGEMKDCSRCDATASKVEPDANPRLVFDSKKLQDLEASNADLRRRIDAMSVQPSIEDRNAIAAAFHKADSVYQMLGDATPQVLPGESPLAYRRRLASGLRKYSERWKAYTFHDSVEGHAFDIIEGAIYADALQHAKNPSTETPGLLRQVVDTTSMPGKTITRFFGDARAAWAPFMPPIKHKLKQFNTSPDRR